MTFDKILLSSTQPGHTDTAWAKPVRGGFALYLYFNGQWQPTVIMNDNQSSSPEDDIPADISNIPAIVEETVQRSIGTQIEEEVTRQMEGHDEAAGDTHNAETGDTTEYPDIHIYG